MMREALVATVVPGSLQAHDVPEKETVSPPYSVDHPSKGNQRPPDLTHIPDAEWDEAVTLYRVVAPIVSAGRPYYRAVKAATQSSGKSTATLYRAIERLGDSDDPAMLLKVPQPKERASRITLAVIDLINTCFFEHYVTNQKRTVVESYKWIVWKCFDAEPPLVPPHFNTVVRRFKKLRANIGEVKFLRRRGDSKASNAYLLRDGTFNDHDAPWARVQMHHTPLDIEVVDEESRETVGRAFCTIAVDVYSRVIVGIYISLDPIGVLSTGLCLHHAMLPKGAWLKRVGVANAWPCHGRPAVLHFDNGKEFLSEPIRKACERLDIRIEHRPVLTPHFAGVVERIFRTLNGFLHAQKGSTFSNPGHRGDNKPGKMAIYTLSELEQQVAEFITIQYNKRKHGTLRRTPLAVYEEAVLGMQGTRGVGRALPNIDERELRLLLMPFKMRTIQHHGVRLFNLLYGGDALRPYVNAKNEDGTPKSFLFRYDARRINDIHFYADDVNEYHRLTLQQPLPDVSLWEWKARRRKLDAMGSREEDIKEQVESYKRIRQREDEAEARTRGARRQKSRRLHHSKVTPIEDVVASPYEDDMGSDDLQPYDDLRRL